MLLTLRSMEETCGGVMYCLETIDKVQRKVFRMKIIFSLLLLFAARSALSGFLNGSITLSSHSDEPTEGDTVELTCNITSTFLPAANRSTLYYYWMVPLVHYIWSYDKWISNHNSSGPAVDRYGNIILGYSFKNDGRTLVINSVRYNDKRFICRGSEDEKAYPNYFNYGVGFEYCLQIIHKPYIYQYDEYIYPDGKKFEAAINENVLLDFNCETYPPYSPKGNWTFVNFHGVSKNLPSNSDIGFYERDCFSYCFLQFNFISTEYYGNYSFNMTNDMGSTSITFQVLPGDPPEAPWNVRIQNVTHNSIVVDFELMWSIPFDRQQPCLQLTQVENGAIVQSSNASYYSFYLFSPTFIYQFLKNIQPETKYKVSVWSRNKFGKSQVVEIEVETQKDPWSFLRSVLAFLGITSTALFAVLYLVKIFRRNRQAQQPPQIAMQEVSAASPQSDVDVVYERVRVNLQNDEHSYTSISQTHSQDQ